MDIRRKILKYAYPFMIAVSKITGKWRQIETSDIQPREPVYLLNTKDNQGNTISFSGFEGKKILLVNTASFCVYTDQYAQLQRLHQETKNELILLGFPSGDFREQEYEDNQEIADLCASYDISFPVMQKSIVTKKDGQHEVFKWLTDASLNGWNDKAPTWNFTKYLIDEMGDLIAVFGPSVVPAEIKKYL
jgi:glutathione peroxidase